MTPRMRLAWLVVFYVALAFTLLFGLGHLAHMVADPSALRPYSDWSGLRPPFLAAMYASHSGFFEFVGCIATVPALIALRRAAHGQPATRWFTAYFALALLVATVVLAAQAFLWIESPIPFAVRAYIEFNAGTFFRTLANVVLLFWPVIPVSILLHIRRRREREGALRGCPHCGYDTSATIRSGIFRCPECGEPLPTTAGT